MYFGLAGAGLEQATQQMTNFTLGNQSAAGSTSKMK